MHIFHRTDSFEEISTVQPGRLGLTFGAGEQIAVTHFTSPTMPS